jgi:hypothetical protein
VVKDRVFPQKKCNIKRRVLNHAILQSTDKNPCHCHNRHLKWKNIVVYKGVGFYNLILFGGFNPLS